MVIVMLLIVIGLAAGAAALSETLSARGHATHDERSARALQAADAGIQAELYRAGQVNLGGQKLTNGLSLSSIFSQLLTCPVPQVNAGGQVIGLQFVALAAVGNSCPSNSTSGISSPANNQEPVGNHAYFDARFFPGLTNIGDFVQLNPKIVAMGVDDNGSTQITRRVEAILAPVSPFRTLEAVHDLEIDVPTTLNILGQSVAGATTFNGTAAAGNNLAIKNAASTLATFTGTNISSGGLTEPSALDSCVPATTTRITLSLVLGSTTTPSPCTGLVSRPAITLSQSKANCPSSCSTTFAGAYTTANGAPEIYNTNSATTLSFAPGDYVFCSFYSAGPVNMNPSGLGAVRIFIDSPHSTNCSGFRAHNGISAGSFSAAKGVTNLLASTHPSQAQVYVVGDASSYWSNSTTPDTSVTATASGLASGQGVFVYAPQSTVTVSSTPSCLAVIGISLTCTGVGTLSGAYVGYNLTATGTLISEDLGLLNYPLSTTLGPFYVKQYIECTPQYPLPTPDPSTGC